MSGVTHIRIRESLEELEAHLRQQKNPRLKERIQALYLLKVGQLASVIEVAKALGRHRATVQRWLAAYRQDGLEAMLEFKTSPGRTPIIPQWAVNSLQKQLEQPQGFKRYTQVQMWLETTLGVQAKYATVHHLTRYKLKAKLKASRPKNHKQDPGLLEGFKKTLVTTCS